MILKEMYKGIDNSPDTKLTTNIGPTDEIIAVEDISVFPEGPNYAVIGKAEDAEVIKYSVKTKDSLSGCVRGLGATKAKSWSAKNVIARNFTKLDHDSLIDNIESLNKNKVEIEEGKTLSSNDYSNEAKAKVDNIPKDPKYTDTTYTSGDNITIDSKNKIKIDISLIDNIESLNKNKVEIEEGKTLSSNDYSNEAKAKVDNIPKDPKYTDTTYTSGDNITIDSKNKIKIDIQTVTSLNDTTDVGIWVVKS